MLVLFHNILIQSNVLTQVISKASRPSSHKAIFRRSKRSEFGGYPKSGNPLSGNVFYALHRNEGGEGRWSEGEEEGDDEDHQEAEDELKRGADFDIVHERVLTGRHYQGVGGRREWGHEAERGAECNGE